MARGDAAASATDQPNRSGTRPGRVERRAAISAAFVPNSAASAPRAARLRNSDASEAYRSPNVITRNAWRSQVPNADSSSGTVNPARGQSASRRRSVSNVCASRRFPESAGAGARSGAASNSWPPGARTRATSNSAAGSIQCRAKLHTTRRKEASAIGSRSAEPRRLGTRASSGHCRNRASIGSEQSSPSQSTRGKARRSDTVDAPTPQARSRPRPPSAGSPPPTSSSTTRM